MTIEYWQASPASRGSNSNRRLHPDGKHDEVLLRRRAIALVIKWQDNSERSEPACPGESIADVPYGIMDRKAEKALMAELLRLQEELVKLQQWVRDQSQRLVIVVEGRDAAGKGGVIKRITEPLNPRWCRVVALPAPSDWERSQWYFQRYAEHLPAAGEIVVFDRSWYNRAGVERVMGFCTEEEVQRFFRQCPAFERMLLDDGIILVKYWFSVSDEEQERRFQDRARDPMKRWKLSQIDLEGRTRWVDYSRAKDDMFAHCDTPDSPWWVVEGDAKLRARVNCIAHLLSVVPYRSVPIPPVKLGRRPAESHDDYERPSRRSSHYVPDYASTSDGSGD